MANNVLDTRLHTHFAIFLYALRLETAMLTKRVLLDAADAERCVKFLSPTDLAFDFTQPFEDNSEANIYQPTEAGRTPGSTITIREGRGACRGTNQIQFCMGRCCLKILRSRHADIALGSDQIECPPRSARRRSPPLRYLPHLARTKTRMLVLPGTGKLQTRQLW